MNDPKLTYTALALYALGAAILFGTLVAISYAPPKENGQMLVHFIVGTLGMLFGHILTILSPSAGGDAASMPPVPPGKSLDSTQAGFALTRLLAMIAAIALVAVGTTGCAGFSTFQQALVGYEGAAYSGLKQVNDNKLAVSIAVLCEGTSVGAAIRNPQSVATLKAACTNGSSDPNSLFDGKQQPPITINLTVPATAASGAK